LGGRVLGPAVLAAALALSAAPACAATAVFRYTGAEQTFVVPADVHTVRAAVIGASGGAGSPWAVGGSGSFLTADLPVTPGQTLYIEVGGAGISGDLCCRPSFNGGGAGGPDTVGDHHGGGGGGASDIRTLPRAAAGSEATRLLVAGGGGGGGGGGSQEQSPGGGSLGRPGRSCAACATEGDAGAASTGGLGGAATGIDATDGGDGALGTGGDGGDGTVGGGGGGGGGRYGGGGGGGGDDTFGPDGGGGGGGGGSDYAVGSYSPGGFIPASPVPLGSGLVTITYAVGIPDAQVTPWSVRFGAQAIASTRERTVTITNRGAGALQLRSATITSTNTDFEVGPGCTAPVPAGASCQLPVRFTPGTAGFHRVHVTLDMNARNRYATLVLTGRGVRAKRTVSQLRISPSRFSAAERGASVAAGGPARVSYRVDVAGTMTFRVLQVRRGVRRGTRCVRAPHDRSANAHTCARLIPLGGSFTQAAVAGANRFRFTGRVRDARRMRRLAPGHYRLRASPQNKLATGRARTVAFRIVR
jgi:hypothetical protein